MTRWRNWAGDRRCEPRAIERPADEAELAELVSGAARRGERVRAVGSGHSFTDCACTDGLMIDLDRMQRVLAVDSHLGHVTVEGIKLHRLGAELATYGPHSRTRETSTPNRWRRHRHRHARDGRELLESLGPHRGGAPDHRAG